MHLILVVATVCYLVMLPLLFLAALGLDQYRARRFRRRLERMQQDYQAWLQQDFREAVEAMERWLAVRQTFSEALTERQQEAEQEQTAKTSTR
jgi:hypothetical protein